MKNLLRSLKSKCDYIFGDSKNSDFITVSGITFPANQPGSVADIMAERQGLNLNSESIPADSFELKLVEQEANLIPTPFLKALRSDLGCSNNKPILNKSYFRVYVPGNDTVPCQEYRSR